MHWLSHLMWWIAHNKWDSLRFLVMAVCIFTLYRLVRMAWYKWKKVYSSKEQVAWYALAGASVAFTEGLFENFLQDNPGGPRILICLIVEVFTIWVTYLPDRPPLSAYLYEENR